MEEQQRRNTGCTGIGRHISFSLLYRSDEYPDIQYSKIGDGLKKSTADPKLKQFLIDGFFGLIIKFTPYSKKIKIEEQKSKKQAGKNKGKKK
ncbi:hypothetical protein MKW98_007150 [Papaver atlanticum]|uniref:Uncharacterized protein n=1 Tax=Papaver atlanticum TaxID=357466 RepID=A0AAD4XI99_9MAGN|nr:hypothetical protein MKW98_007150 [Papaver atlanticum]